MRLKPGVKLADLQPQMVLGLVIADGAYREIAVEMVVTSANDSRHRADSLHYRGLAVDLRTKSVPRAQLDALVATIHARLGAEFDVILEYRGGEQEHLHVEFDP